MLYSIDRKIPLTEDIVTFQVDVTPKPKEVLPRNSAVVALVVANELAYAEAWRRGKYPNKDKQGRTIKRAKPEPWATQEVERLAK